VSGWVLRATVCPRYWGRCWRYRWIIWASLPRSADLLIAEGYTWTLAGAVRKCGKLGVPMVRVPSRPKLRADR
jgi:hypothetical protein